MFDKTKNCEALVLITFLFFKVPDQPRVGGINKKNKFKRKHNQPRMNPVNPDETFNKLNKELKDSILKLDILSMFSSPLRELNTIHLEKNFKQCSIYDFRCMISCGELVLLLSCGVNKYFLVVKFFIQYVFFYKAFKCL
jgi:hypothetical protein